MARTGPKSLLVSSSSSIISPVTTLTCTAWGVAHGHSVIPKSKTPSRIRANLEGDFKLDPEDLQKIDSLDKKLRFNDPSKRFGWDFFTDLDGKKK